jgi:hypothetical protein
LKPEVTQEIGLIGTGAFETASSHEEEDHGAVDFVASAKFESGLVVKRVKGALGIEFHVPFESWSEIMTHDQAGNPAV